MIETQKYIRKPLYVDAVRITSANFDEIAAWCQGEIQQDEVLGHGAPKKYIKVRVHNPKNPRQTKAFVGDWLLYTERGYKVYTHKAFLASFDLVQGGPDTVSPELEAENPSQETGVQPIEVYPATPEAIAAAVRANEQLMAAPEGHDGRRILSLEEQERMDPEELRELIRSGEVVLAQDLAA